jgi:four helix bundle protein
MNQPADDASAAARAVPLLDAEKLDVYRVALRFQALACSVTFRRGYSALRDQLVRASASIVLNTAEGSGRRTPADKGRFFAIARGSATECAAILDVARASGIASPTECSRGRDLLVRVVQMLTRLCQRCERQVQR